jgi:hypothetical protein
MHPYAPVTQDPTAGNSKGALAENYNRPPVVIEEAFTTQFKCNWWLRLYPVDACNPCAVLRPPLHFQYKIIHQKKQIKKA